MKIENDKRQNAQHELIEYVATLRQRNDDKLTIVVYNHAVTINVLNNVITRSFYDSLNEIAMCNDIDFYVAYNTVEKCMCVRFLL